MILAATGLTVNKYTLSPFSLNRTLSPFNIWRGLALVDDSEISFGVDFEIPYKTDYIAVFFCCN